MMIFKSKDGRVLSLAELAATTGAVSWEMESGRSYSKEAIELHQRGRDAGSSGDTEKALRLFQEAAKAAPDWPYPYYDIAFTHLLAGDSDKALAYYQKVESLAPRGFFTAKTAIHTLLREAKGEWPKGLYLRYLSLEWIDDLEEKRSRVDHLVASVPDFAPGWKEKALLLDDDAAVLEAIENGLKADPDPETMGFLLINKALVLYRSGNKEESIRMLSDLITNPDTTLSSEQIAKATLAGILEA